MLGSVNHKGRVTQESLKTKEDPSLCAAIPERRVTAPTKHSGSNLQKYNASAGSVHVLKVMGVHDSPSHITLGAAAPSQGELLSRCERPPGRCLGSQVRSSQCYLLCLNLASTWFMEQVLITSWPDADPRSTEPTSLSHASSHVTSGPTMTVCLLKYPRPPRPSGEPFSSSVCACMCTYVCTHLQACVSPPQSDWDPVEAGACLTWLDGAHSQYSSRKRGKDRGSSGKVSPWLPHFLVGPSPVSKFLSFLRPHESLLSSLPELPPNQPGHPKAEPSELGLRGALQRANHRHIT